MNPFALTLAALLLSSLPVLAQESETDRLKKEVDKLKADNDVLSRQLEVYMAYLRDFNDRLSKEKLGKGTADSLAQDLAMLERNHVELARQKKLLEEKVRAAAAPAPVTSPDNRDREMKAAALAALEAATQKAFEEAKRPLPPRLVPRLHGTTPALTGKVTAVANEIGLVVLSVGSDNGVLEGAEFTVYRGGDFVAKVVVDRVDRKWSAAKVVLKKQDPRVADDVSNAIFTPQPKAGAELLALRKELDEVRNQVRQLTDRLVPAYHGAGVSVEEASEALRDHLAIQRGLVVRRIREGSPAEKAGLKQHDVIPDLLEAQLVEAVESGKPIDIVRQGMKMRLKGR